MKKAKTVYVCQECGYESPKWQGQCICGKWNTMIEETVVELKGDDARRRAGNSDKVKASRLMMLYLETR